MMNVTSCKRPFQNGKDEKAGSIPPAPQTARWKSDAACGDVEERRFSAAQTWMLGMGFIAPGVSFSSPQSKTTTSPKGRQFVGPNAVLKGRSPTSLPATLELSRFKLLLSIRSGKREQKPDPPHAVT